MKNDHLKIVVSFIVGALFGTGLIISKMTDPSVIIGFLDITGTWLPATMLVMVGAIAVHAPLTYFITKRSYPIFDKKFYLSDNFNIDSPLVLGAALFGAGWGLAGYCPGPAIVSLGTGSTDVILFCAAMLIGMSISTKIRFS